MCYKVHVCSIEISGKEMMGQMLASNAFSVFFT